MCGFCAGHEMMEHNFFACPLAKHIWNIAGFNFGVLEISKNMLDMFQKWIVTSFGVQRFGAQAHLYPIRK